jgi:hypothetical protein
MSKDISLVKNSRFLSKIDCDPAISLTVDHVSEENVSPDGLGKTMKYVAYFTDCDKGFVLNWTNSQKIAQLTRINDMDEWTGCTVELQHDPDIVYAGKIVGGIRVKGATSPSVPEPDFAQDNAFLE